MRKRNGRLWVTVFAETAAQAAETVSGRGFTPTGDPVQTNDPPVGGLHGWEVPVEIPAAILGSVA